MEDINVNKNTDVNVDDNKNVDINANSKTFTQDELDRIINDRLSRQKSQYKDYDELKKAAEELTSIKQSQLSREEQMQAQLKEYENKLNAIELERKTESLLNLKKDALKEAGLSDALASRIQGETAEEIKADIEAIKAIMAPTKPSEIGGTAGNQVQTQQTVTLAMYNAMSYREKVDFSQNNPEGYKALMG
jgi:hypothetical protein